ncbi:MAG: PQQ-binding-like beta-propeller repeat protein [Steroidobacteraceae bacterium]
MTLGRFASRTLSGSAVLLFACASLVGRTGLGATAPDSARIALAPAFTAEQLTAPPTTGWVTNGGDLFNQRHSPLTQIDRDNVAHLKAEWRTHLDRSGLGPQYSGQAQPLAYRGVMYVVTGADDVFALDVRTGRILWRYRAHLDPQRVRVCCGWVSRGVGLGDGKVFVGQVDAKLVALDQRTGRIVWSIQAEDPLKGYGITSAPLYYDGMIITGFAGGDMGIRGRVKAYSAKSGKLIWTFYTIPGPGELGHDTWPSDNDYWKFGGAPVWQTPAIDPRLGMIYFSTGNAGPDYGGAARAGDNLFTSSIVALDVKTGKYRWHFQQVHHDIWDYDSPNPVVLFDAMYGGRLRHGIAEISKTGWVYLLDRETGKPLIGIIEKPVPQEPRQATAKTQPYPIGDPLFPQKVDIAPEGFTLVNGGRIFTPYWDKPIVYRPQMAVNWPPSSYDPATNRFFVCGIDNLATSSHDPKPFSPPKFDGMWEQNGPFVRTGVRGRGIFGAYDLTTNRLVWEQQWPEGCMSGSIDTAGGLVFVGRSDGRLTALDSSTGQRLWQFQTDAGVNATPSTFEYRGRQYVAVISAGTLFGGGKKGDSVWLFSLHGSIDSRPLQAAERRFTGALPGAPAPVNVVYAPGTANLPNGKQLYHLFCNACHGATGLGGHGGGISLVNAAKNPRYIIATATLGKNGHMPSFRGALTPDQLRDVAGYISKELIRAGG